ncbi:hypothetical protein DRO69_10930 [Candidatus Bathyarchaeota archaeon]|nr:MAG: hypothetical protein DRO69_10930 [Candidatus Bathyarchaeota archaeon]
MSRTGVGDKPYEIDAENIDRFPLMGKFFEFTTLTEMEQKVKVQIVSNSTISNFTFIKYFHPEKGQNISLIKFLRRRIQSVQVFAESLSLIYFFKVLTKF